MPSTMISKSDIPSIEGVPIVKEGIYGPSSSGRGKFSGRMECSTSGWSQGALYMHHHSPRENSSGEENVNGPYQQIWRTDGAYDGAVRQGGVH